MSRIIRGIEGRRYQHLNLEEVLKKYLLSLQDEQSWEFVCDALTYHDNNLRQNELVRLFSAAGIPNIWPSLEKNTLLSPYTSSGDNNKTLEHWLRELVDYRNDAAHGRTDDTLGTTSLREWINFVRALCEALAEIVTHRIIQDEVTKNPQSIIGNITEYYSNNIVVAKCKDGHLRIGQYLYFLTSNSCVMAFIESIQFNDENITEIEFNGEEKEIGLRISCKVSRHANVVIIQD